MEVVTLTVVPPQNPERVVARPFLDGRHSNMREIRLRPGQALPPHTHGDSDLMLHVAEGNGMLDTDNRTAEFPTGALAYFRGDEELRVRNDDTGGLTLLAFLAPPCPSRREET